MIVHDQWLRAQMMLFEQRGFLDIINQYNEAHEMRGGMITTNETPTVCATSLYTTNLLSLLRSHHTRELYVEGDFRFFDWNVEVTCGGDLDIDTEDLQPIGGRRLVTSGLAGCTGIALQGCVDGSVVCNFLRHDKDFSSDSLSIKLAKLERCIARVMNWCVTHGHRHVVVDAYVIGGTDWEFVNSASQRAEARRVVRWARTQQRLRLKFYDVSVNVEADETSVTIVMDGHNVWALRGK